MSRTSYADVYLIFVTNWPAVLPDNKNSSEPCTFDQLAAGGGGNTPTAKNKGKIGYLRDSFMFCHLGISVQVKPHESTFWDTHD